MNFTVTLPWTTTGSFQTVSAWTRIGWGAVPNRSNTGTIRSSRALDGERFLRRRRQAARGVLALRRNRHPLHHAALPPAEKHGECPLFWHELLDRRPVALDHRPVQQRRAESLVSAR